MGGAPRIPLVNWRGALVSADMIAPLDALAASVGPLVSPIPGFGSYRDNAASGGTDSGSGHLDIYARTGWTQADRDRFVANARRMGFCCWERPQRWWSQTRRKWLTETWAWHFHLLLKDSADLSPGARTQIQRWYSGSNGLVGGDPDLGPRTYLRQTWRQYVAAKTQVGTGSKPPTGGPVTPKPPTQEDNMPTPAQLWDYPMGQNPGDPKKATDAGDALKIASNYAYHNFRELVDQRQKLADLTAAVQALAAAVADLKKG